MEIDVTKLVEDVDCSQFAQSQFESGLSNIGQITWRNALRYIADEGPLVTAAQQDDLRGWIGEFGAWSQEEIDAMSDQETNALLLQFVAGDIREMEDHFDSYKEYQKAAEEGRVGGSLYRSGRRWYYYVGN